MPDRIARFSGRYAFLSNLHCGNRGENRLGKLLMQVRDEITHAEVTR